jgi:Acetokinase family
MANRKWQMAKPGCFASWTVSSGAFQLSGIGHRIVHGGPALSAPRVVTDDLLRTLGQIVPFAPNHLPDEMQLIERAGQLRPDVPQFVCFDTAFHAGLPDVARRLPVPQSYEAEGVRRYGFHGLSYTYLLRELGPAREPGAGRWQDRADAPRQRIERGRRARGPVHGYQHGVHAIRGVVMSSRSGDLLAFSVSTSTTSPTSGTPRSSRLQRQAPVQVFVTSEHRHEGHAINSQPLQTPGRA